MPLSRQLLHKRWLWCSLSALFCYVVCGPFFTIGPPHLSDVRADAQYNASWHLETSTVSWTGATLSYEGYATGIVGRLRYQTALGHERVSGKYSLPPQDAVGSREPVWVSRAGGLFVVNDENGYGGTPLADSAGNIAAQSWTIMAFYSLGIGYGLCFLLITIGRRRWPGSAQPPTLVAPS